MLVVESVLGCEDLLSESFCLDQFDLSLSADNCQRLAKDPEYGIGNGNQGQSCLLLAVSLFVILEPKPLASGNLTPDSSRRLRKKSLVTWALFSLAPEPPPSPGKRLIVH